LALEDKKEIPIEPERVVPENAMTYTEYLDQLKKKNEQLYKDENKTKTPVGINDTNLDISPRVKDESEYQEWLNTLHQKKKKPKDKKEDPTEAEINKMVGEKLIIGPTDRKENKPTYNSNYARPIKGNDNRSDFNYSNTEFPVL
jgi:hypothetical protein